MPRTAQDEELAALLSGRFPAGDAMTRFADLMASFRRAGITSRDLVASVPPRWQGAFLDRVVGLEPTAADEILESCWTSSATKAPVLIACSSVAPNLPVERAVVWSSRLREQANLKRECPLLVQAADPSRPPDARVRAAAAAARNFGDRRAGPLVRRAAEEIVDPRIRAAVRAELYDLAPDLIGPFDAGASELVEPAGTPDTRPDPPDDLTVPGKFPISEDMHAMAIRLSRVPGMRIPWGGLEVLAWAMDAVPADHRTDALHGEEPLVLVLGTGRCGTSAATKVLSLLGLSLTAAEDLSPSDSNNPTGYFESRVIKRASEVLISMMTGIWNGLDNALTAKQTPGEIWDLTAPSLEAVRPVLARLLNQILPTGSPVPTVLKTPQLSPVLPYWHQVIGRPIVIVFMFRNPIDVARSLISGRWFSDDLRHLFAVWERYNRQGMSNIAGLPVLVSSYDDFVADPAGWCETAAPFLSSHGVDVPDPLPIDEVLSFVDPSLHRNRAGRAEMSNTPGLPPSVRSIFEQLDSRRGPHETWEPPALAPEEDWVEEALWQAYPHVRRAPARPGA